MALTLTKADSNLQVNQVILMLTNTVVSKYAGKGLKMLQHQLAFATQENIPVNNFPSIPGGKKMTSRSSSRLFSNMVCKLGNIEFI